MLCMYIFLLDFECIRKEAWQYKLEGYIFVHKYGYTRMLSVYPNLQSLFAEDLK